MTPNFKRKILVIKYILTESCVCVWSKISPTIHCVQSKWKQSFIRTFFVVYLPTSKNKPDPMLRKYIIGTYMKWLANNIKDIIKSSNGGRCFTNLQIVQHTKIHRCSILRVHRELFFGGLKLKFLTTYFNFLKQTKYLHTKIM